MWKRTSAGCAQGATQLTSQHILRAKPGPGRHMTTHYFIHFLSQKSECRVTTQEPSEIETRKTQRGKDVSHTGLKCQYRASLKVYHVTPCSHCLSHSQTPVQAPCQPCACSSFLRDKSFLPCLLTSLTCSSVQSTQTDAHLTP